MDKNIRDESLFTSAAQMAGADNYNEWTFSLLQPYIRGSVLEVGCGVGSFTYRIIQHGSFERLLSIDISQNAVDHCRAKFAHAALQFQCIDVWNVHGEFDMVICMNVLEHIEDHEGVLKHLFDILKPGGTLFLLVPAHQALFNNFDTEGGHFRRYNKRAIRDLLLKVTGSRRYQLNQFYFNSIGALGYWFVSDYLTL
jgi:2-polyprenyl-3-methyl-5-hydroxy-6-metoxy-1,4-benzoquinol methylase